MKSFIKLTALLFLSFKTFAQIEKPLDNPKKITFVYKTTPNLYFEKNSLYADTLFLQVLFPNKKYLKVNSPNDSSKIVGKILKSDLTNHELADLTEMVYHSFDEQNYVYDVRNNTTKISGSICKALDCAAAFKIFFDDNDSSGTDFSNREIKYFDTVKLIETKSFYSKTQYKKKSVNYNNIIVTWIDTTNRIGNYKIITENETVDAAITLTADPTLDKHITPIDLFSNCNYGLIEIKSKRATTKLIKVVYE